MVLTPTPDKAYVSLDQFELLRKFKREGTLAKKQLSQDLWLTKEQAKELGFNQGEEEFKLSPAEPLPGDVYGRIAQQPIPEFKPPEIAPEAGGNISNLLLRLYPTQFAPKVSQGMKPDEVLKTVQTQIELDPEQFLRELQLTNMPTESEVLLKYLGADQDLINQIITPQQKQGQLLQTLGKIAEFKGYNVESLANLLETNPQQF